MAQQQQPKIDWSGLPDIDLSGLPDDPDRDEPSATSKLFGQLNTAPKFITDRTRIDPNKTITEGKALGGLLEVPGALWDIAKNAISNPRSIPAMAGGFARGAVEGAGELASPINIADAATGFGKAPAMRLANRVISAGNIPMGVDTMMNGDPMAGLAQIGFGAAGMTSQGVTMPSRKPKINPNLADAAIQPPVTTSSGFAPAMAQNVPMQKDPFDEMIDALNVKGGTEVEIMGQDGPINNASGESSASYENIMRERGMKNNGEQFVVYDAAGNKRPIVVDGVDYKVQPGESYGVEGPNGFQLRDDAGGAYPGSPKYQALGKVPSSNFKPSVLPPKITLKNPTPMALKEAMDNGYVFDIDATVDDGFFGMKRVAQRGDTPILEAEVPLAQVSSRATPPPKPPKRGIDEGPITPTQKDPKLPEEPSLLRKAYELPRALMSVDLPFSTSAAFRQALPLLGTKNWFKALKVSMQSYSKIPGVKNSGAEFYEGVMADLKNHPLFRPRPDPMNPGKFKKSFAEEIGVRTTDLGKDLTAREEATRSTWAEKLPWVRASNRAYTVFLNHLRVNTLESLIKDSDILQQGGMNNMPLMKNLAEFINDATGRSSLKTQVGFGKEISLEKSAKLLTDAFFSPRLMASRIRMLNPNTYMMAPKGVRKQYVHGMMRAIGSWWTIASLAEMAGAEVSKDPRSSDFGKIKIGNTRLDPGAGFQQFLVLGSRMRPEWTGMNEPMDTGITPLDLAGNLAGMGGGGTTSTGKSTYGKFRPFGVGFKPETRVSTGIEFGANKLHPTVKFAYDLMRASENRPVNMADRTVQMFLPIIAGDIAELAKEDPALLPLIIPLGSFGMGSQTYSGGIEEPNFVPDSWDIKVGGKSTRRQSRSR
jgi:hypothetical protein